VSGSALRTPVAIAVVAGLVLGKPFGILLFSWLSVRCGLAQLPAGISWLALAGAACLGRIGFTMALFLAGLAFEKPLLSSAKIGILAASAISAIVGTLLLVVTLRRPAD
jgi:NhaA family Na+:H+ antiporter